MSSVDPHSSHVSARSLCISSLRSNLFRVGRLVYEDGLPVPLQGYATEPCHQWAFSHCPAVLRPWRHALSPCSVCTVLL